MVRQGTDTRKEPSSKGSPAPRAVLRPNSHPILGRDSQKETKGRVGP